MLALERSRNTYLDLFVNAPIAYFTLDSDGRIEVMNHAAVTLLSNTARRLTGRRFETLVSRDNVEPWRSHLREAKASHAAVVADFALVVGRKPIIVRASSSHLADDGGRTMTALIDVTDRVGASGDRSWRRDLVRTEIRHSQVQAQVHSILLVEDDADVREAMSTLLRKLRYDVHSVGTAAAARDKARGQPFDVLVSDIRLPDGSGLDLMRDLHASHAHMKGIAISGLATPGDVEAAIQAGFAIHLKKPVGFPDLSSSLREILPLDLLG
jgi:PAS domain S-box-containing protein